MVLLRSSRVFRKACNVKILRKYSLKPSLEIRVGREKYKHTKNDDWIGVVGLEIHAQILSETKLFSGSSTRFGVSANTQVSYFDAGLPGTLPVLNRRCVEAAISTALALDCKINKKSVFDRKHYFYGDLPVGYQITQQRLPLAVDGEISFIVRNTNCLTKKPYMLKSHIKQLQLEQDSGKSLHDDEAGKSLIDLNRAGVPLMEIVFEPDLSNGEEAAALIKELHLILRKLRTCDCKMEEGSLRVDANVSVHKAGDPFGVRTEIKNLNSIRGVAKAVDYEIERQIEILCSGGVVQNETRTFDVKSKKTISMRDKESIQDYRFMPEPNLPPLLLCDDNDLEVEAASRINITNLHKDLPELPKQMRETLMTSYGLTLVASDQLLENEEIYQYFLEIIKMNRIPAKNLAHCLLTNILTVLYKCNIEVKQCPLKTADLAVLIEMEFAGIISSEISVQVLELLIKGDSRLPTQIIDENEWRQLTDEYELKKICQEIIMSNDKLVDSYKSGKTRAINTLLGKVRKRTNDKANMLLATKLMKELLNKNL